MYYENYNFFFVEFIDGLKFYIILDLKKLSVKLLFQIHKTMILLKQNIGNSNQYNVKFHIKQVILKYII